MIVLSRPGSDPGCNIFSAQFDAMIILSTLIGCSKFSTNQNALKSAERIQIYVEKWVGPWVWTSHREANGLLFHE